MTKIVIQIALNFGVKITNQTLFIFVRHRPFKGRQECLSDPGNLGPAGHHAPRNCVCLCKFVQQKAAFLNLSTPPFGFLISFLQYLNFLHRETECVAEEGGTQIFAPPAENTFRMAPNRPKRKIIERQCQQRDIYTIEVNCVMRIWYQP